MVVSYPAVFYKEFDGRYSVLFPDLNVSTYGDDLEDAKRMAIDCLAGDIKFRQDENWDIPEPTRDMDKIDVDKLVDYDDYVEASKRIITVDVDGYAKKYFDTMEITVTISKWLNEEASKLGINISHLLHDALLDEIYELRNEK